MKPWAEPFGDHRAPLIHVFSRVEGRLRPGARGHFALASLPRAKPGRVDDAHPPLPPPARLQGVIAGVAAAGALVASVLGARHLTQRATLRRQDGSDGVRLEVAHFADVTTMVDTEASVASLRAVCRTWEQALDHATCTSHPQPLRFGRGTALRSTPTVAFAAAEVYTLLLTTIPLERLVSAE